MIMIIKKKADVNICLASHFTPLYFLKFKVSATVFSVWSPVTCYMFIWLFAPQLFENLGCMIERERSQSVEPRQRCYRETSPVEPRRTCRSVNGQWIKIVGFFSFFFCFFVYESVWWFLETTVHCCQRGREKRKSWVSHTINTHIRERSSRLLMLITTDQTSVSAEAPPPATERDDN